MCRYRHVMRLVPESLFVPLAPCVNLPMWPYSRSRGADQVFRPSGGVVAVSRFADWSAIVTLLCPERGQGCNRVSATEGSGHAAGQPIFEGRL